MGHTNGLTPNGEPDAQEWARPVREAASRNPPTARWQGAAGRPHTYVSTWAGWVYVAFVIDAYARRILGWRAATSMTTPLVLDCLDMALFTRRREGITGFEGLTHHTDAGSVYTSIAFTDRLVDEGIDPSVGSVGDAYDNSLAESQIGLYKSELIHHEGPWRDVDQVEAATASWVLWFTTERTHGSIDDLTPLEVEQLDYARNEPVERAG